MATIAVPKTAPQIQAGAYDRLFYTSMTMVMALVVFLGFAPTYYLRSYFGGLQTVTGAVTLTPLAHLHAALFTAWVVLLVVQTGLIAGHRVAIHRRLGIAGGILAAGMVVVGSMTAIRAAARGSAPPGTDALAFLAVPLGDMVIFAFLVGAALALRRDKEAHKRLMLLAYISILVAAVARLPGVITMGPYGFFGLTFIFLLIAVVYDLVSRRRVHRVYIWGGSVLVASVPLRLLLSGTEAWRSLAQFLIGTLS